MKPTKENCFQNVGAFRKRAGFERRALWTRYNRTSIADYVEENGIDQVLVLYSAANFATDANLFLLAR